MKIKKIETSIKLVLWMDKYIKLSLILQKCEKIILCGMEME